MPSLVFFRNCLAFSFFWRAGWETSLKRRRLFAIMPKKASESGFVSFWCVLLLWRSFTPNQINIIFFTYNRIQQERKTEREMSRTAFRSCHTTTAKFKKIILTKILGFLQRIFRFGSSWLTLLPLQILRTYVSLITTRTCNNQSLSQS